LVGNILSDETKAALAKELEAGEGLDMLKILQALERTNLKLWSAWTPEEIAQLKHKIKNEPEGDEPEDRKTASPPPSAQPMDIDSSSSDVEIDAADKVDKKKDGDGKSKVDPKKKAVPPKPRGKRGLDDSTADSNKKPNTRSGTLPGNEGTNAVDLSAIIAGSAASASTPTVKKPTPAGAGEGGRAGKSGGFAAKFAAAAKKA
ncbi:hypothetical protein JCM10213_009064, partial [Rhodosporidiobolus nylandii]